MNLKLIKQYLNKNRIDLWLIYSFKSSNPIIKYFIKDQFLTRKVFIFVYPNKNGVILCHELDKLEIDKKVDFQVVVYKNLQQMKDIIKNLLSNCQNVIMEISEDGMLAGCNYLDYGTGKMIENMGKNILSSADIIQRLSSTIDNQSLILHKKASEEIDKDEEDYETDEEIELLEKLLAQKKARKRDKDFEM